jgi:hypothetical protein
MSWKLGLIVLIAALASCGRQPCESDSDDDGPRVRIDLALETCNVPPDALIVAPTRVEKKTLVNLDGSKSIDANGDALTYAWKLLSKPGPSKADLEGATSAAASFTPDRSGQYMVELIVNDGDLSSAPRTGTIMVENKVPIANAGSDLAVPIGEVAVLDGRQSSDADGDPIQYLWRLQSRPFGSNATLDDPRSAQPRFTVDIRGVYELVLRVNDGDLGIAEDSVRVGGGVTGSPPFADAGRDATDLLGKTAALDGTASIDPDGDALTYSWRIVEQPPSMAPAMLDRDNSARPTFVPNEVGMYTFELVTNDGFYDSLPDRVTYRIDPGTGVSGDECQVAGCALGKQCFGGICVGVGRLRASLSWTVLSDFDLHVKTPGGVEISYLDPDAGGGMLDVDDCIGNVCAVPSATHVENIVFEMEPARGTYEVWVQNYSGGAAGAYTIEVSGAAQSSFTGNLPATSGLDSMHYFFEVR